MSRFDRHTQRRGAERIARQIRRGGIQLGGDLPSVRDLSPGARSAVFSDEPDRNLAQPGIPREISALPDARLVATIVELGCPPWAAWQMVKHPSGRYNLTAVWCLVQDAAEGNMVQNARTGEWTSARELVDGIREQYQEARRVELISDRPDHTIGLWER